MRSKLMVGLLAVILAVAGVVGSAAPAAKQPSVSIESPEYNQTIPFGEDGTVHVCGYCNPANATVECKVWYWSETLDDWARLAIDDWTTTAIDGFYEHYGQGLAGWTYYIEVTVRQGLATATDSTMYHIGPAMEEQCSAFAAKQPAVSISTPTPNQAIWYEDARPFTFTGTCYPSNAFVKFDLWYWDETEQDWVSTAGAQTFGSGGEYSKDYYLNSALQYYMVVTAYQGLAEASEDVYFSVSPIGAKVK